MTNPTTTSVRTENEATIRSTYQALSRGDMASMYQLFAPDSVSHIPGRNPLSGDKLGVDALVEYFGELMARSEGTLIVDLRHAFADETYGAGIHHETGRRAGRQLDMQNVVVFRFADGKVAETWVHYHDQTVADMFWS
jgi:ketosteroid isomerase-like protein